MMRNLITIYIFLVSAFAMAQDSVLFTQGKESYKAEQYTEAIESWKKILDNGNHSEALYFNLANAHYKLNNIGPSIYYYEKALQLAPNDTDIKTNMAFAENAKIDAIEPLPRTIFNKWYRNVTGVFSFNGWARAAVFFSILFVALFLGYYFISQENKKKLFFSTSLLSVLFFIISITFAYVTFNDVQKDKPAIIFAESVEIKTAPKLNSNTAFKLHEGTKVQILDIDGDWMRIRIADGKDGWIFKTDVKTL